MFTPRGLFTAIITPFTASGDVAKHMFLKLIDQQIEGGVDGIVVCGSTGEGATLSSIEKLELFRWATEHANGRVSIIAGTGSNDTNATIELSRRAKLFGVDALLVVVPYYNKPTPAGQIEHFKSVNDAVELPQIIYNVPGRTSTNMSAATQVRIAELCPNIVATKEASANLEQISEIISHAPASFKVLSGDDSLTLPVIAAGGTGVVSVISNYLPNTFGSLVKSCLKEDFPAARAIQTRLIPYFRANFLESNPIPVKYIMHKLHAVPLKYRLPLTAPSDLTSAALNEIIAPIEQMEKEYS